MALPEYTDTTFIEDYYALMQDAAIAMGFSLSTVSNKKDSNTKSLSVWPDYIALTKNEPTPLLHADVSCCIFCHDNAYFFQNIRT
jgi:hypothetical protein